MLTREELYNMYWVQMMSQSEIAEKFGVVCSTIGSWMRKYGIETRTHSESLLIKSHDPPKEKLYNMYCVQLMSVPKIAEVYDVTPSTIVCWMKRCGIESRTCSESKLHGISILSREELYNMYWIQGISQQEIAKNINVMDSTISCWMRRYRIEIRTLSEARLNGDFTGEKNGRWKNGISFEPYCEKFDNKFKEAVRERDDYTCQLCDVEQKPNGRKLSVHHVHYDKANCYPDVVALCCSCNSRVNTDRDYWEEHFENQLLERGLYCWSISA